MTPDAIRIHFAAICIALLAFDWNGSRCAEPTWPESRFVERSDRAIQKSWAPLSDELSANDLFDLELVELMEVEVNSVTKQPQSWFASAAAVYVIDREQIRRSGARRIPELLRRVPGVQVARIDSTRWAITARGFASRFANKLLVLIDGRSVYHPLFSGVFWDVQETLIDEVERIEVARGPGGTLWEANAVNGVINIITRSAAESTGTLLRVGGGGETPLRGALRFGDSLGRGAPSDGAYRVFASYLEEDSTRLESSGDDGPDQAAQERVGFRVDLNPDQRRHLMLQGELYRSERGAITELAAASEPLRPQVRSDELAEGGHLLARWEEKLRAESGYSLQLYFDRRRRETAAYDVRLDSFDLDFQHHFRPRSDHLLTWGAGVRVTRDEGQGSETLTLDPNERQTQLWSAFVQDQIDLAGPELRLTVGTKLEHNPFSGAEWQPSLRLGWHPEPRHFFWSAVTRALRTPSRSDVDVRVKGSIPLALARNPLDPSAGSLPGYLELVGSEHFRAEEQIAYELGYRFRDADRFSLDLTLFSARYRNLQDFAASDRLRCSPSGLPYPGCAGDDDVVFIEADFVNGLNANASGIELSANWYPAPNLDFELGYSYLAIDQDGDGSEPYNEDLNPPHQLRFSAFWEPTPNLELALLTRYVDRLEEDQIADYIATDARIGWRLSRSAQLELIARNLFDPAHIEFESDLLRSPRSEIERSLFLGLRLEH